MKNTSAFDQKLVILVGTFVHTCTVNLHAWAYDTSRTQDSITGVLLFQRLFLKFDRHTKYIHVHCVP